MKDCTKCFAAVPELWPRGKTAWRCKHPDAGEWRGRVVGTPGAGQMPIEPPKWCPKEK